MLERFSDFVKEPRQWAERAAAAGWLSNREKAAISSIEVGDPSALFSASERRPLVVAFFGGTGVGKSSLLNRLAGYSIARTGVERPTSREVSAFLHHSVRISRLPQEFPTEKIKIGYHNDDQNQSVLWIDMPDIDSTEGKNRQIVLQWLPHIDVLIYVVSPERYRDDKGWRMLLSRGHEHAWLFIMNHWDQGREVQLDAFKTQIEAAGFDNPIILRSDCLNNTPDDFDRLRTTVSALATENTIKQLEARGLAIRIQRIVAGIEQCLGAMGADGAQREMENEWVKEWAKTEKLIIDGLDWPIQEFAKVYIEKGPISLPSKPDLESESAEVDKRTGLIVWDAWAQTRVGDTLDNLIIKSDVLETPAKPLKTRLQPLRGKVPSVIENQMEQSLREAMSGQGTGPRQYFLKLAKIMSIILPLSAIIWVGYRLAYSYYQLGLSEGDYLGINFAIHSALLIAAAWLFPWFLSRKLTPSEESVAIDGLRNGLEEGLENLAGKVQKAIEQTFEERRALLESGRGLITQYQKLTLADQKSDNQTLQRVLKRA